MTRKAWIESGVVRDVCPGNPAESYHQDIAVLYTTDVPDGTVNGATLVNGVWTNPPPPPPPAPPPPPPPPARHITRLAFRNRFTQAEKVAIEMAALDNPAATLAERQNAAALRASMKDQENAAYIDLDRPDTRAGVQNLETMGLLAAGRALEILDAAVQDAERA